MKPDERKEALRRLRTLSSSQAMISIIGGEPTLRPDFLVDAIKDAADAGFFVSAVSNGWGLTDDLIARLSDAGLSYLAVSVDSDRTSPKRNLERAIERLGAAKQYGIVPVVNSVITSETDIADFKAFAGTIIDNGIFISPLTCSPKVPGGAFSNASRDAVPSRRQLRELVPWLAMKKITTGRVASSFGYLWTLYNLHPGQDGNTESWHCSPNFRSPSKRDGRGYLSLDSDGFIGPCQEFPRRINLLDIPPEQLSLQFLDPIFTETTEQCPGCIYNCYINEEEVHGAKALTEVTTGYQAITLFSNRPR